MVKTNINKKQLNTNKRYEENMYGSPEILHTKYVRWKTRWRNSIITFAPVAVCWQTGRLLLVSCSCRWRHKHWCPDTVLGSNSTRIAFGQSLPEDRYSIFFKIFSLMRSYPGQEIPCQSHIEISTGLKMDIRHNIHFPAKIGMQFH